MRRLRFVSLALSGVLAACAGRTPAPNPLTQRIDPGPLVSSLRDYNSGPAAVRISGSLKAGDRGTVDFGATSAEGIGVRLDALAGPFSTPVLALACRSGEACTAFLPGRRVAYSDDAGRWDGLLGPLLRGRVPSLDESAAVGAWKTESGEQALVLEGRDGWREQIEFDSGERLPRAVYLSRKGETEARILYGDFGEPVGGKPFPSRVEVWLRETGKTYEIRFRRAEAADSGVDPNLFVLSLPSNTTVESLRGKTTWEETGIPIWPPLLGRTTGPP